MVENEIKSEEKSFFEKYATIIFVFLAFSITWVILFSLVAKFSALSYEIQEIWHSLGAIGPAIAGISIIAHLRGRAGLRLVKERMLKFSGFRVLLFSFAPLIILGITLTVESLVGTFNLQQFIQENNLSNMGSIIIFLLPSISYGFFEEFGWRGFLLPKLQSRYNALKSTLILTPIWFVWHTPAFFYRYDWSFVPFMLPLMLTGSIVFTYLFNESGGSLLMVILLHITYDIVAANPWGAATYVISIFYVMMDIRILKIYGVENFSRHERVKEI